jgi:hypothetical protein
MPGTAPCAIRASSPIRAPWGATPPSAP